MLKSVKNFRPIGCDCLNANCSKDTFSRNTVHQHIGHVYRSARPDNITKDDLATLHNDIGIRTVIDLRNFESEYLHEDGMKLLDGTDRAVEVVDVREMEMTSADDVIWKLTRHEIKTGEMRHFMVECYGTTFLRKLLLSNLVPRSRRFRIFILWMISIFVGTKLLASSIKCLMRSIGNLNLYKMTVDFCGVSIRTSFQLLNKRENLPALICCHSGRDRTGILSALLLAMCGVDRKTIAADFNINQTPDNSTCDVILRLLEYIDDKHGSVSKYLETIGFSVEEQEQLKHLILIENNIV